MQAVEHDELAAEDRDAGQRGCRRRLARRRTVPSPGRPTRPRRRSDRRAAHPPRSRRCRRAGRRRRRRRCRPRRSRSCRARHRCRVDPYEVETATGDPEARRRRSSSARVCAGRLPAAGSGSAARAPSKRTSAPSRCESTHVDARSRTRTARRRRSARADTIGRRRDARHRAAVVEREPRDAASAPDVDRRLRQVDPLRDLARPGRDAHSTAWSRSTTQTAPPALAIAHGRKPGVRIVATKRPACVRRSTREPSRHASHSDPAAAASAFCGYGIALVRQAGPTSAPASGGGAVPAAGTGARRRHRAEQEERSDW